jgi:hypothetical protein
VITLTYIPAQRNFEELLSQAVDEALSSLGESAKQVIYYYLEKSYNLNKEEIPNRISDFAAAIEKFFGVGANFLETLILKQICGKTGESFKVDVSGDRDFTRCVTVAKRTVVKLEKFEAKT